MNYYKKPEERMSDAEYLRYCFGSQSIDVVNELYIHGVDFSAKEKKWDLIKASRVRQEGIKS
jgi:hypothetical protein